MSTTEILGRIQTDLKKDAPLQRYLPELVKSLNSQKPFISVNMNAKQQLTQLQSLIQNELKMIQNSLKQQQIDLEAEQQPEEEIDDGENQEEMEVEEEYDQDNEDEGQFQGKDQDEEQDQEDKFQEPEFTKKAKGKKQSKHEQNEMQDENDQNYADQEEQDQNQDDQNQDQVQSNDDQQAFQGEQDVGLYGQELNSNDEDIQNYENQFDQEQYKEFEKQFGEGQNTKGKKSKSKRKSQDEEEDDNPDEHIQDNFDHFRQIQLDNQKAELQTEAQPKTQLDNQIDRLQSKIFGKKQWAMKGQVKAKQRPANSLLEYDLQFSSGIKYSHEITEQRNTELQELIKKRILSEMFDDRSRFVNTSHIREHFGSLKEVSREKSKMGLGEVYESQFKNFLGIGENKNDKLKTEIMDSFKELNYYLDSLSNFSFVPKPTKDTAKKGQSEAIIVEQKVPLTLWNGQKQVSKDNKHRFESQKQVDNQAKRLKNKRIARQRKKEQMKKKLNKKIEYGGTTKFLAQAKQKAMANNKPLKVDGVNMKYNKSASFFKNINDNKGGKPNPDISKMKI